MKRRSGAAKPVLHQRIARRLRTLRRRLVFRRAMRRFIDDPESCAYAESPLLRDLIYGWDNEQASGLSEYLSACISHALISAGPILECGSGLTTILVGVLAEARRVPLWVLEHNAKWAGRTEQALGRYKIGSAVVCTKPLKDFGDYYWYDAPLESMPESFSMVICDGPPGSTRGGRYGLVPVMRERLRPGCIILLDDAGREAEMAIAKRWESELGASSRVVGSDKPYIEMVVSG